MDVLNRQRRPSARTRLAGAALASAIAGYAGMAWAAPDIIVKYLPIDNPTTPTNLNLTVSADGRYIAHRANYPSSTTADIMIYDVVAATRTQANLTVNGSAPTNAQCDTPSISADGRYVVFGCQGAAMGVTVPGNGAAYFVYDRLANKTEVIPPISAATVNRTIPAAISADGHYVAFRTSDASNNFTLSLRNMLSKTTAATGAKSVYVGLFPANMNISSDGRYAGYFGRIIPSNSIPDISVFDAVSGITEVINVSTAGVHGTQGGWYSTMSADGNVVTFLSSDTALVSPPAPGGGVYVRDRAAHTTELISGFVTGGTAATPTMSANGRYVAFTGNPTATVKNLYVYDRLTKTNRIIPGAIGAGRNAVNPTFSADGRYLVFESIVNGSSHSIGYADLGAAAGLTLSPAPAALTEGGAAGTYTAVLAQVPSANVIVTIAPDRQVSVARTQLTFTPQNWNVPQVISVQALQDGIAEGAHSGKVTHTVTSSDINYTVIPVASVTVAINDAVVPTIVAPGSPWTQPDLPLTGTASPGATVLLTASGRGTGALISLSAQADTQGNWSLTFTGLASDIYDLDAQADGIQSAVTTVTITLP